MNFIKPFNVPFVGLFILICSMTLTVNAQTCNEGKPYVIGVEAIDYSPHYNFVDKSQPSFFSDFIEWLSQKTQCKFHIEALPIKRLNLAYEIGGKIDFIYPDNPSWHNKEAESKRSYSLSIVTAIGGTIVRKEDKNITLDKFSRLAFPRGFSPVAWYPLQSQYDITFTETSNALSALQMVLAGRVDGADIELNVANYLVNYKALGELVLAENLPYVPTSFHLSTIKHKAFLNEINKLIEEFQSELSSLKKQSKLVEQAS